MTQYLLKKSLAFIKLNNPPLNSLSLSLRDGLMRAMDSAVADKADCLVLYGDGKAFSAGADISEFAKGLHLSRPSLREVIDRLDAYDKPVIAYVNGLALGGGLETALSCHWRYGSPKCAVGLPEVHLGILPGAGGTQRLPRLCGVATAVDIMTSGRTLSAKEALKHRILDDISPSLITNIDELEENIHQFINKQGVLTKPLHEKRLSLLPIPGDISSELFQQLHKSIEKSSKGFIAPKNILRAVEQAVACGVGETSFNNGMTKESELFAELATNSQSKALQYFFFSERKVSAPPKISEAYTTPSTTARASALAGPIDHVGVIGGGTMGAGIAMSFINSNVPVTLIENNEELAQKAFQRIEDTYKQSSAFKSGKMSSEALKQTLSFLTVSSNLNDLKTSDMIIEAVFENIQLKKDIFMKLNSICKPTCVLASNTSCLDIDDISSVSKYPHNVLGTHFFSPANVMKLLEIVRGKNTSVEALTSCVNVSKRINKVSAIAGNCYGFIGNRMLEPYGREAMFLLEEGCTPAQIDGVLKRSLGLAMGIFEMSDLAGNDVGWRQRSERKLTNGGHLLLAEDSNRLSPDYPGMRYCGIGDALCEKGKFGQKTGSGWYKYDSSAPRVPIECSETIELIKDYSAQHGIERREISNEEILERCMFSLVNEGFKILEEGIADQPEVIDVVYVYGYGFPKYRGGPMFWAEQEVGLQKVITSLKKFYEKHPNQIWLKPSKLLEDVVMSGSTIREEIFFRSKNKQLRSKN